VNVYTSKNWPF